MKKILAIAVSLVMVFAVAVSASALFGFRPSTTPIRVDGFKVDVTLYDRGTTGAGNSMITGTYPVHAPTSGVRAGEIYAFAVEVTMPAYNGLTATGQTLVNTPSTSLRVTTSNLMNFAATTASSRTAALAAPAYGAGMTDATWGALPVNGTLTIGLDALNALTDGQGNAGIVPDTADEPQAEFVFSAECAIRTLADASVSAVFGSPDPRVGGSSGAATCMIGNWGVFRDANAYTMEEYGSNGNLNNNQISFVVGAADNAGNRSILSTYVTDGTTTALVSQSPTTGAIQFHDQVNNAPIIDANTYSVLNGILTRAMSAMGFTWVPGGVLYDEGFEALAARGLQFSDSATFYAYTASLTVPGGSSPTVVPDTGDNTVIGIVMMAVAVLTLGIVVVRKVRA